MCVSQQSQHNMRMQEYMRKQMRDITASAEPWLSKEEAMFPGEVVEIQYLTAGRHQQC